MAKGKDAEDLVGDTTKRAKNVLAGKGSGAGASKGAAGAKGQGKQGAIVAAAGKGAAKAKGQSLGERSAKVKAEKAKAKVAERSAKGEGQYYFPADAPERKAIRKKLEGVKEEISSREFASKNGFETWKVRLVAQAMEREKPSALRLTKSGDTGGMLMINAPKRK